MKRRRRIALTAAAALAAIVTLIGVTVVALSSSTGRHALIAFALGQAHYVTPFDIKVANVDEAPGGGTRLNGLQISDGDGVLLDKATLEIDIRPWKLLHGEVSVARLDLSGLHLLRSPDSGPSPILPLPPVLPAWPRAPFSLVVDQIRLTDITIAENVTDLQEIQFSAEGRVSDLNTGQEISLSVWRVDGREGSLSLNSAIGVAGQAPQFLLEAGEGPEGLIATLFGSPIPAPMTMRVAAHGPSGGWQADLAFKLQDQLQIDGSARASFTGVRSLNAVLRARSGKALDADVAALIGEAARLDLDFVETTSEQMTLERAEVHFAAGQIVAGGTFAPETGEGQFTLSGTVNSAPLTPWTKPLIFAEGHWNAQAAFRENGWELTGKATVSEPVMPDQRARDATVDFTAGATGETAPRFTAALHVEQPEFEDPTIQAFLGDEIDLTVAGTYRPQIIDLTRLELTAAAGRLAGSARYAPEGTEKSMTLKGETHLLSLLMAQQDIVLKTVETTELKIASSGPDNAVRIDLSVDADKPQTTTPILQALLANRATITVIADVDPSGAVELQQAKLASKAISATVAGPISPDDADLAYRVDIARAGDILDVAGIADVSGKLQAKGRIEGSLEAPVAVGSVILHDGDLAGTRLGNLHLNHRLKIAPDLVGSLSLAVKDSTFGDGKLDVQVAQSDDAVLLEQIDWFAAGISGAGAAQLALDGGPISGNMAVIADDLSRFGALIDIDLKGAVEGDFVLGGSALDQPPATAAAGLRFSKLRIAGQSMAEMRVDVTIDDPFSAANVKARIDGKNGEIAGNSVATISATIDGDPSFARLSLAATAPDAAVPFSLASEGTSARKNSVLDLSIDGFRLGSGDERYRWCNRFRSGSPATGSRLMVLRLR